MLVILTGQQAQTGTVQPDHEVWSFHRVGVLKITEGKLDGRWPLLTERWTRPGTAILFPHQCFLEGRAGRDVITPVRGSPVPRVQLREECTVLAKTAVTFLLQWGRRLENTRRAGPTVCTSQGWKGSALSSLGPCEGPSAAGRAAHLPPEPCRRLTCVTTAPPGGSKTPPSTSPYSRCSSFLIPASRGRGQQASVAESGAHSGPSSWLQATLGPGS